MSPRPHRRRERPARPGGEAGAGPLVLDGFSDLVDLGRGGFASVYRAVEAGTDRPVALKVLDVTGAHPRRIEAFYREVRTLATVSSHPNIVTLYRAVATPDGRPVLVLELCRGSYAHRVRTEGSLPAAEVISVGIKMAGALETAHRAGFLHRDVKPQNVLVTQFGEPALADFGLATLQASGPSVDRVVPFTTLHAPPEVLEGNGLSPATDVYGLASTLYQLLTGAPPFTAFDGESPAAVILRILHEPASPVTRTDIPLALSDLIIAALAKDPSERPGTAAAMADELREIEMASGWSPTPYLVWGDEPAKASRVQPGPSAGGPLVAPLDPQPSPNAARPSAPSRDIATTPPRGPAVIAPLVSERRVLSPATPPPPGLARRAPAPADSGAQTAPAPEPGWDEPRRRPAPRRVPPGGPARPTVADMPLPDVAFSAMPPLPPNPPGAPGTTPVATVPGPERPFRPSLGASRPPAALPVPSEPKAPAATTWALAQEPRLQQTADPSFETADPQSGVREEPDGADGSPSLVARHSSVVMGALSLAALATVIVVLILAGVF